jgi:hypothetical protein
MSIMFLVGFLVGHSFGSLNRSFGPICGPSMLESSSFLLFHGMCV